MMQRYNFKQRNQAITTRIRNWAVTNIRCALGMNKEVNMEFLQANNVMIE